MTLNEIAATVRGRRTSLGWSQAALAERAGVSRKWIYEFEAGKSSAELGRLLRVLDALDITLELRQRDAPTASELTVPLAAAMRKQLLARSAEQPGVAAAIQQYLARSGGTAPLPPAATLAALEASLAARVSPPVTANEVDQTPDARRRREEQ